MDGCVMAVTMATVAAAAVTVAATAAEEAVAVGWGEAAAMAGNARGVCQREMAEPFVQVEERWAEG